MSRELTRAALAAKEIRQYLKQKGIKARVKSKNFSMGSSVDVYVTDQPPDVVAMIKTDIDKYEYGTFDAMTDCSGFKNRDFDGPQAKYVHVSNEHSPELLQAFWEFLRPIYNGADALPEKYEDIKPTDRIFDDWAGAVIWRVLSGNWDQKISKMFWDQYAKPKAPKPINGGGIGEYTHTKKGFQMFIVTLPCRVEREEYLNLLEIAKSLGGWYSRRWQDTPAGFAFKERENAEQFLTHIEDPENNAVTPKEAAPINRGPKLRELADKMQSAIDDKFADRLTNTQKRLAQAAHARLEGEKLQRTQTVLYALADMYDNGTITDELRQYTTKKSVYDLMGTEKTHVQNGYHTYYACTGKPRTESPLWALLKPKTEEEKEQEQLKRDIDSLQLSNIPGFFPTPEEVAQRMFELADVEAGMCVLEPSGGTGALIKPVVDNVDTEILTYEYNSSLCDILRRSFPDYRVCVKNEDFLEVTDHQGCYPRIIMNPPFDMGADIKHIKHAMTLLKPGGKLVALCSGGPRQEKELQPLATSWERLPEGSFKESGTMVNAVLLMIDN